MAFSNKQNTFISEVDELDSWFNDLDEETVEIINKNLIKEEDSESDAVKIRNEKDIKNEDDKNADVKNDDADDDEHDDDEHDDEHENNIEDKYIEDILSKNPAEMKANDVIQSECSIAYFVQVLLEGNPNNKIKTLKNYDVDLTFDKITDIISYLQWISDACENLANRIGQEILIYHFDDIPSIVRSSYNFCTKYTQCKNFYSKHETPSCKEHHYVHSFLKYDIDSVIMFLNYVNKNNITMSNTEQNNLYLSIKTICFVTRHMAKEIKYIDFITKNNSEFFHRNNPIDMNKKKNAIRKSQNSGWNSNDHMMDRHLTDRHLTDRHLTDRHPTDRHLTDRHLTDRHRRTEIDETGFYNPISTNETSIRNQQTRIFAPINRADDDNTSLKKSVQNRRWGSETDNQTDIRYRNLNRNKSGFDSGFGEFRSNDNGKCDDKTKSGNQLLSRQNITNSDKQTSRNEIGSFNSRKFDNKYNKYNKNTSTPNNSDRKNRINDTGINNQDNFKHSNNQNIYSILSGF